MNSQNDSYRFGLAAWTMMIGAVFFLADDVRAADQEAWLRFGGRLHPLIVHFPIGLVVTGAIFEFWSWIRRRASSPAGLACCGMAVLTGALACGAGWLYADHEGVASSMEETLFWHRWGSIGMTGLVALIWIFGVLAARRGQQSVLYRFGLMVAALGVGLSAHLGGDMTRGEGYLFEVFEQVEADEAETEVAVAGVPEPGKIDYLTQVKPILAEHCFRCHGPRRRKGGLRLDQRRFVFHDRPQDWVIKVGNPDESLLIERMLLDPSHKEYMPQDAEFPVPAEQIETLKEWIVQGASFTRVAAKPGNQEGDGEPNSEGNAESAAAEANGEGAANRGEGSESDGEAQDPTAGEASPAGGAGAPARSEAVDKSLASLRDIGAAASYEGAELATVSVDFSVAAKFEAAQLQLLQGLESNLVRLDLKRCPVGDSELALVGRFPRLNYLNLSQTKVGDTALKSLSDLPELEVLNLWGSQVSDAGIDALASIPKLKRVYLWNSKVTKEGAAKLRAARPGLVVDRGE